MPINKGECVFHGVAKFSSDTKFGKTDLKSISEVIKAIFKEYKTHSGIKDFLDVKLELVRVENLEWEPALPSKWAEVFNSDLNRVWGHIDNVMEAAVDAGYQYFTWNGWVYAIIKGMTDCKQLNLKAENLK